MIYMPQTPYHFDVPEKKKIRLIIDTDAKNEADDAFAIVHALLTPKFKIKGIIASHFGTHLNRCSMQESYDEIQNILEIMDMPESVPVFHGSADALPNEFSPQTSEGTECIIREALTDDPRPLFAIFLGPLTDMASAYLLEPRIANRMTAIWIGGGAWPDGGEEFNLKNDIHAANTIFSSDLPLWQVPRDVYCSMRVSLAELQTRVKPCGKIGQYLFDQLVACNNHWADNPVWPLGESWVLGDSPAVGLLLDPHEYCFTEKPAPRILEDMVYIHRKHDRFIRIYNRIDPRFVLEDIYSKLQLNFR